MATPKRTKKQDASQPEKVRVSHTVCSALYRRFRLTAADLDLSESELFELLMTMTVSGTHARGVSAELRAAAGQGRGSDDPGLTAQSVTIPQTVQFNRVSKDIGNIARSSTAPVDDAIDSLPPIKYNSTPIV